VVATVAMAAPAPAGAAPPAAIDQYTEQPPGSGGGAAAGLETGTDPSAPPASSAAPAPAPAAPVPVEPATPSLAAKTSDGVEPEPWAREATIAPARPSRPAAVVVDRAGISGDELPLLGYPTTAFVTVLVALVAVALVLRLGLALQRRRSVARP
jgi:hypothetical protein